MYVQLAIDIAFARGQKLFQVAQSIVLLCFYSYTSARYAFRLTFTASLTSQTTASSKSGSTAASRPASPAHSD